MKTFDPSAHPRATTGTFTERDHTAPEIALNTDTITCTQCGTVRTRGSIHRCAAPGLMILSDATVKVLAACRRAGGRPLIVGGSVRDALLSQDSKTPTVPKDIDIEVHDVAGYEPLQKQLAKLGQVDLAGASFGVLLVVVDGEHFDVALPRTEKKVGAGHRGFETTANPQLGEVQAAARRDFTINAMAWDPETAELVDPWGGTADLADGVLRHPTAAFAEDPLRVLRAARFASRLGFRIAPETVELARSISDRFDEIPTERVWSEWRNIALNSVDVTGAIRALEETDWLRHFPNLAATRGVEQEFSWHPEGDVLTHLGMAADVAASNAAIDGLSDDDREVAVFGALVHDFGKTVSTVVLTDDAGVERITSRGHEDSGVPLAEEFLRSIGAPERLTKRVLPLVAEHMCHMSLIPGRDPNLNVVRRLIRRLAHGGSGATIFDWARVVDADVNGRGTPTGPSRGAAWLEVAGRVGPTPKKSLLTGVHIKAAGWPPGPAWAATIKAAVDAQDDGMITDEASAIAWFAEHGESIRAATPFVVAESKAEKKSRLKDANAARLEEDPHV